MKPTNTNPPYLLLDGEGCSCSFMAKADAPVFWERCETLATTMHEMDSEVVQKHIQFQQEHPKSIVMLYPGNFVYLCDTHLELLKG